jgi:hypothetical protein
MTVLPGRPAARADRSRGKIGNTDNHVWKEIRWTDTFFQHVDILTRLYLRPLSWDGFPQSLDGHIVHQARNDDGLSEPLLLEQFKRTKSRAGMSVGREGSTAGDGQF